jgi:hypothetical protein
MQASWEQVSLPTGLWEPGTSRRGSMKERDKGRLFAQALLCAHRNIHKNEMRWKALFIIPLCSANTLPYLGGEILTRPITVYNRTRRPEQIPCAPQRAEQLCVTYSRDRTVP